MLCGRVFVGLTVVGGCVLGGCRGKVLLGVYYGFRVVVVTFRVVLVSRLWVLRVHGVGFRGLLGCFRASVNPEP